MSLKCKFDVPEAGWLPVSISMGGFSLEIDASDVPCDPIFQLTVALYKVLKGIDSEVWWHLEPAGYYFYFKKLEEDSYQITITFEEDSSSPEKPVICLIGTKQEIIFPFWRAIKEFSSHHYNEPHWPELDKRELKKLTELIKEKYV
jgi:hypothetical protein